MSKSCVSDNLLSFIYVKFYRTKFKYVIFTFPMYVLLLHRLQWSHNKIISLLTTPGTRKKGVRRAMERASKLF